MSDGISEGRRAALATDDFWDMWEEAQFENIILDIKNQLLSLTYAETVDRLIKVAKRIEIETYSKFKHPIPEYGYVSSLPKEDADKAEIVDLYKITFHGPVSHAFESLSLHEAFAEALIFAEWLATEEGKVAVSVYYDY